MKIAVLSDIHGNLPALHAVAADIEAWKPDQVIVAGDIVNRGPRSRDCLNFVLEKQAIAGWHLLRGNHEDYVVDCGGPRFETQGPSFEIQRFAYFAYEQLNGEVPILSTLPELYRWFAPDESEFRVAHASMESNRDGIYEKTSNGRLREQIAPPPAVFVTAHTHQPLIRRLDDALVVNVGSVGAPFDLDWRPSYGRFTWNATTGWRARIVRVAYNRDLLERDYVNSGFLEQGGPLAQLMLVELRKSRGLIFRWASRYETAVLEGEIGLAESVGRILLEDDVRPYLGPPGWDLDTVRSAVETHASNKIESKT